MAGYTRQSIADIINGADITAPPLNAEFNQLSAAFNASTGHSHDGTTGNAPKIDLTTSVTGYLPAVNGGVGGKNNLSATTTPLTTDDSTLGYAPGSLWENTTTGRVYICVGNTAGSAVWRELVQVESGNAILPAAHDTIDIGSASVRFQDLYLSGGIAAAGNLSVGGTSTLGGVTSTSLSTSGNLSVTGTSSFTGAISAGSLTTTGNSTHATVDINGGAIDGTIIGASSAAAGSFTTVNTSGQATLASANIDAGTIDGTVIGGASPAAITGTTITANTGFSGALTGNVTGNVTGNLTGNVTGNVTGDVTGNVTAASGTSTFNNVTINGGLDMNAGTTATITNLTSPTNTNDAATKGYVDTADALKLNLSGGTMSGDIAMGSNKVTGLGTPTASTDAATKGYVDTSVSNLVDAAPGTLDTLNELAAALGDDPNFSTTITNSIATKLPLAGGTMSGNIAMGTNSITGMADPTLAQDAATKSYVDTADATKLNLSGGTMSGAIAMATNKITGVGDPTANQDAATKNYVDTQDATKLSLSGGTMTGAIDMGANKITTTYTPTDAADLTTKTYVDGILGSATSAAASAAAAATSASNAATSESNAATSASAAAASYDDFDDRYLGAKASAPSVDNDGDALVTGALYFNTTGGAMYAWNGSAWQGVSPDLVGDLTPQLGGDLDSNGNDILFGDNDKAIFGAGSDLQIYHDGSNSVIADVGTGSLEIRGTDLKLQDASGANYISMLDGGTGGTVYLKYNGSDKLATTSTGIDVTGTVTADGLTVDTNTLHVDSANNRVGIGTSSPIVRTHVIEASGEGNPAALTTETLRVQRNAGSGSGAAMSIVAGTSAQAGLYFGDATSVSSGGVLYENGIDAMVFRANNADRLRIDSSGNVGIGTSSPSRGPLHLSTSSGATELHMTNANTGSTSSDGFTLFMGASAASDGAGVWYREAGPLRFATSASERMRIDSSGNVGIGTTSPSSKLDVAGAAEVNGNLTVTGNSGTFIANTSNRALTTTDVWNAQAESTLSDGATITPNLATAVNFKVTLGGNRTLANPSNMKVGQRGRIKVIQDATGGRTLSFGSYYDFAGGSAYALEGSTSGQYDILYYDVVSTTSIVISGIGNVS